MPDSDENKAKDWLNVSEAARYLDVSRETIYKLMEESVLPYTKVKGLQGRRIKRQDLEALFERFGSEGSEAVEAEADQKKSSKKKKK